MSVLGKVVGYASLLAFGWFAHATYDALAERNDAYVCSERHGITLITKQDEQLSVPADALFENYKLSLFVKGRLDSLTSDYEQFKDRLLSSPTHKLMGTIDELIK